MNFVYICKDGENEELRYSLRSIVKNCKVDSLFVVGGKPDWYLGNYIPVTQKYSKYKNAFLNFKTICDSDEISKDFVLMNDDFFITKPINKIITYYNGTLQNKIDNYEKVLGRSSYINKLIITNDRLLKNGIQNPLNYEIHVPMSMCKSNFKEILTNNHNILYRSVYGNTFNDEAKEMIDVKVYQSDSFKTLSYNYTDNKYPFLSTDPGSFLYLKDLYLKKAFVDKTEYEK